jgi:CRP-like cAMP-binding protein
MAHRCKVEGSLVYAHRGPIWHCSELEYRQLLPVITTLTVSPGRKLAEQGRLTRQFVILVEGTAAVLRNDSWVEELTPGAQVGGLTVIYGARHPTTVVALTSVVVDVIGEREFRSVVPVLEGFNRWVRTEADRQLRDWHVTEADGIVSTLTEGPAGRRAVA